MPARDNLSHPNVAMTQDAATVGLKWERQEFINNHRRRQAVVKLHHQIFIFNY